MLYLELEKCAQPMKAFKEAEDVIVSGDLSKHFEITSFGSGFLQRNVIEGKEDINEIEFENAKSSLVFEVIEEEKTPGDKSHQSMMSYLQGVDRNYNRCASQKYK